MAEKEYIERGALIEFVKQYSPTIDGFTTLQCVENAIKEVPAADVVEVVRCKDCRYFDVIIDCCTNELAMHSCHADDFCSYGERKG